MKVQADFMRRITAFVGVISLLTACSSGDIVVKTDLDESYVVKDSAVTEIESPIDSRIDHHNKMIKFTRDNINEWIEESIDCRSDLDQATCDDIWLSRNPKREAEIKESEAHIQLLEEAKESKDPLIKQVKYRPIFIDLNDKKTAMGYVTLTCLNPNVEAKKAAKLFAALGETLEDVDLSKAYYSAGSKVCRKYAYKDGGVFAYREAKKSDESD